MRNFIFSKHESSEVAIEYSQFKRPIGAHEQHLLLIWYGNIANYMQEIGTNSKRDLCLSAALPLEILNTRFSDACIEHKILYGLGWSSSSRATSYSHFVFSYPEMSCGTVPKHLKFFQSEFQMKYMNAKYRSWIC